MTKTATPTRLRFVAKAVDGGKKFGVYDTVNASYPVETPFLREAGIDRLDWLTDMAEAERIAALLNGTDPVDTLGPTVSEDEDDSMADLAAAIIADQKS